MPLWYCPLVTALLIVGTAARVRMSRRTVNAGPSSPRNASATHIRRGSNGYQAELPSSWLDAVGPHTLTITAPTGPVLTLTWEIVDTSKTATILGALALPLRPVHSDAVPT